MINAFFQARFSEGEQRWANRFATAVWVVSAALLVALAVWTAGPA
jgi:hypothetical protein